jgi:hypothetical protein
MWCAFETMRHATVAMAVFMRGADSESTSVALCPTDRSEREESIPALDRKRAAVLAQARGYAFRARDLAGVDGEPVLYWWNKDDFREYSAFPLLGSRFKAAAGVKTGNDPRFLRYWFEVRAADVPRVEAHAFDRPWQFYIKGGAGAEWVEPANLVIRWSRDALELRVYGAYVATKTVRLRDRAMYFQRGIAFSPIGASFSARAHRAPSIVGNMGASVFCDDIASTLCTLNSSRARRVVQALNPGIHFETEDVKRVPLFPIDGANRIYERIVESFTSHERQRESSVEFLQPGASTWRYAQRWAQRGGRPRRGRPLPPYVPDTECKSPLPGHVRLVCRRLWH